MIWIVYRIFGVETTLDPLAVELVLLVTVAAAFLRSAVRALRGTTPPGPLALAVAILALPFGAVRGQARMRSSDLMSVPSQRMETRPSGGSQR